MIKTNLVPLDRAARLGIGLFVLATPLLNLHTFPYNLLGLVPLATAFAGFCPLYKIGSALFGKRGDASLGPRNLTPHEGLGS